MKLSCTEEYANDEIAIQRSTGRRQTRTMLANGLPNAERVRSVSHLRCTGASPMLSKTARSAQVQRPAFQPYAIVIGGSSTPEITPPIGTPDCLSEKTRFMLRWIDARVRRCEAAGLVTPYPRPMIQAPSAMAA